MEFISSVDQDMSRVNKANKWDILFNTRNNFIFPNIHVLFCLYKKYSYCPTKIEQYTLMRFMLIDTCEIIMNINHICEIIDFISGGKINQKPLYFI